MGIGFEHIVIAYKYMNIEKTSTTVMPAFCFVRAMARQGGNYAVNGTIAVDRYLGDAAYLVRCGDGYPWLNSVLLDGNAFRFEGCVDTAVFCCIASGSQPGCLFHPWAGRH